MQIRIRHLSRAAPESRPKCSATSMMKRHISLFGSRVYAGMSFCTLRVKVVYRVDRLPFVRAPEKGFLQHCFRRGDGIPCKYFRDMVIDKYKPFIHNPLQTGHTDQISVCARFNSTPTNFCNVLTAKQVCSTSFSGQRAEITTATLLQQILA